MWFFTQDVWGFDVGALQFRARWFKSTQYLWHVEHGIWFLFLGPFEVSGHTRKETPHLHFSEEDTQLLESWMHDPSEVSF